MAQYYGTLKGARGEASRLGTKKSGLSMSANAWDIGVDVHIDWSSSEQTDLVTVYLTHGSNGPSTCISLGTWKVIEGEFIKEM